MSDIIETFAKRLDFAMKKRNIKSVELHEKTGISESLISKYLSGNANARQKKLLSISKVLDVNPVWLMGYDIPMEKQEEKLESKLLKLDKYMEENNLDKINLIPIYNKIYLKVNWKENPTGYTPFDAKIQGCPEDREYFYYKVSDNSMSIEKDTYILIEDTQKVNINDIILYSIDNNTIELGIYKLNLQQEKNFVVLGKYIK